MKRSMLSIAIGLLTLLGILLVAVPPKTFATTGPSHFLTASRYQVPMKLAQQYVGRYQLVSAARAAQLKTGAMGIEIESTHHQLYGVAQFAGYERSFQSIWIATLFNFHQTKSKVMILDVLAQTGGTLLGRMFLSRAKNGDLTGQIELPKGRFAITWHKLPK